MKKSILLVFILQGLFFSQKILPETSSANAKNIQVKIIPYGGEDYAKSINCKPSDTVLDLKINIENKIISVFPEYQKLFLVKKDSLGDQKLEMKDSNTLSYYGIENQAEIRLVINPSDVPLFTVI